MGNFVAIVICDIFDLFGSVVSKHRVSKLLKKFEALMSSDVSEPVPN